jgi:hypothetical protein
MQNGCAANFENKFAKLRIPVRALNQDAWADTTTTISRPTGNTAGIRTLDPESPLMLAKLHAVFLALVVLTYSGSVDAQMYLCIAEVATGFWFNKSTKSWETAQFDLKEEKYILKGSNDRWTWTKVGEQFGDTCNKGFADAGYFRCDRLSIIYMNSNNLRFQLTSPTGYPDSHESNGEAANTPTLNWEVYRGRVATDGGATAPIFHNSRACTLVNFRLNTSPCCALKSLDFSRSILCDFWPTPRSPTFDSRS